MREASPGVVKIAHRLTELAACTIAAMPKISRALAATLAAAAFVGAASAASGTAAYFESPSKNIVCAYITGGGLTMLECGIASGLVPPPPKPSAHNCGGDDFASNRVRLNATGKYYSFCSGDVGVLAAQGHAPVLAYGKTWHKGPFTCSSATTGVTCKNTSGHGFFLSRLHWHSI